jgi:hypothetical protein
MKLSFVFLPQMRPFIIAFSAVLFSTVCLAEVSDVDNSSFLKIVGSAYSLETGALLYRETHQLLDNDLHEVEYSEPDGRVFAHKTLDFSQSRITPSFSQRNERNGESIDVKQLNSRLQINYLENRTAQPEEDSIPLVAGMVVDAGFDAFVKQYWDTLDAGKQMDIEYLVPSKQTTFSFRVAKVACLAGTQADAVCFALSPVSWLVKMAVDPIVVAYDSTKKTLLRFTGRANICDEQGKYQSVDIQYHYF